VIKKKIVIVGAGGQGRVVSTILALNDQVEVVGFVDPIFKSPNERINGLPVLGNLDILPVLNSDGVYSAVIAIGNNQLRALRFEQLDAQGFELINAIHPTAIIEHNATLYRGVVVAAGAIICCNTIIRDNCIINTGAIVEHETKIDANVHIAPGANIAGRVEIGHNTFIGIGATVKDYIHIGQNVTVGAGAVVIDDVPDDMVVVGVPARPIRKKGEINL
jgi:sugar O-acyltransferase (sialic acid O-acetyltransferase NeuD family)